MHPRVLLSAFATAAVFAASSAGAQTNVALAEQLFRDASELMRNGNVAAACPKFAESQKLDPQLGTLLNLATCHEKEGKTATAWGEYSELLDQAKRRGDTARYDYTEKHLAELEPKLSRVKVDPGTAKLDVVRLDGHELGPAAWSVAFPVDPGEHRFEFEAGGKKQSLEVTVTDPGTKIVTVPPFDSSPPANDVVPPPITPPPPAEPTGRGNGQRMAGYIVGGVGVVGLGIGTIFGVTALGKKSDVDAHCNGPICDETGMAAQDDARSAATLSTVGFVAGALLVAGGVALIVTAPKSSSSVALRPANGGLRVDVTF